MSTATQYNPNADLNAQLVAAGASKTVYALVTPAVERLKMEVLNSPSYLGYFREAWTGKQDAYHEEFFDEWVGWSAPVIDFDRSRFPYYYPCAGASEGIRQIIFDLAAQRPHAVVHIMRGDYEGYRAMAEAAGLAIEEHGRDKPVTGIGSDDLFFISQPSAIDGNVWHDFNSFLATMPANSVVADVTYVGAVQQHKIGERFNINSPAVHSLVFSLSKPFGVYYDRIGGVFQRSENLALFGNRWFKNLTSLKVGTHLLRTVGVFDLPDMVAAYQREMLVRVKNKLGLEFAPSDVVILGHSLSSDPSAMANYLRRAGKMRICLTPGMYDLIVETEVSRPKWG
jgi:hypothetical protein